MWYNHCFFDEELPFSPVYHRNQDIFKLFQASYGICDLGEFRAGFNDARLKTPPSDTAAEMLPRWWFHRDTEWLGRQENGWWGIHRLEGPLAKRHLPQKTQSGTHQLFLELGVAAVGMKKSSKDGCVRKMPMSSMLQLWMNLICSVEMDEKTCQCVQADRRCDEKEGRHMQAKAPRRREFQQWLATPCPLRKDGTAEADHGTREGWVPQGHNRAITICMPTTQEELEDDWHRQLCGLSFVNWRRRTCSSREGLLWGHRACAQDVTTTALPRRPSIFLSVLLRTSVRLTMTN